MRNILIRSMIRQRMRTGVLVLLIAAASFAFVMRIVEYIVITDKIDEISGYYRSIGFLTSADDANVFVPNNVLIGAEVIRNSPFVAFEDRRRGASGVMPDMLNSDVQASGRIHGLEPGETSLLIFYPRQQDAFFYGELVRKEFIMAVTNEIGIPPHLRLVFHVDYVLHGYPEHILAGQEVVMRYFPALHEVEQNHLYEVIGITESALDDMVIGQRYFLRSSFHLPIMAGGQPRPIPQPGVYDVALSMKPLNMNVSLRHRWMDSEEIWFIPVQPYEHVDSSTPGLEMLDDIIESLSHSKRTITLRTTTDMTSMPTTQMPNPHIRLTAGRFINREDYLNSNPVAVVHALFAEMRNLEIGDTITIEVPQEQILHGTTVKYDIEGGLGLEFLTCPQALNVSELELTIVGMIRTIYDDGLRWHVRNYDRSAMTTYIYLPDSVLPRDFIISANPYVAENLAFWTDFNSPILPIIEDAMQMVDDIVDDPTFLPHPWYSFVLNDTRDEAAFVTQYRDTLAALGFNITFFEHNADVFWASATPILQAITLNVIMFCVVLILILALVTFLYLRQRKREFAILRALGVPAKKVNRQLIGSILLLGLPAVIIGGASGWFFALGQAANTINPFGEIVTHVPLDLSISVPIFYLLVLVLIILVSLFVMSVIGAVQINRRSVLEMLQGNAGRRK